MIALLDFGEEAFLVVGWYTIHYRSTLRKFWIFNFDSFQNHIEFNLGWLTLLGDVSLSSHRVYISLQLGYILAVLKHSTLSNGSVWLLFCLIDISQKDAYRRRLGLLVKQLLQHLLILFAIILFIIINLHLHLLVILVKPFVHISVSFLLLRFPE